MAAELQGCPCPVLLCPSCPCLTWQKPHRHSQKEQVKAGEEWDSAPQVSVEGWLGAPAHTLLRWGSQAHPGPNKPCWSSDSLAKGDSTDCSAQVESQPQSTRTWGFREEMCSPCRLFSPSSGAEVQVWMQGVALAPQADSVTLQGPGKDDPMFTTSYIHCLSWQTHNPIHSLWKFM